VLAVTRTVRKLVAHEALGALLYARPAISGGRDRGGSLGDIGWGVSGFGGSDSGGSDGGAAGGAVGSMTRSGRALAALG
jgi:hypothetical protein